MTKLKVIFDTDPGVDDAMALLLLARHPKIDLLGVTTIFGNASLEQVTHNALYLKDTFGFDAPIAAGTDTALELPPEAPPAFVHGDNGLGDVDLPETTKAQKDERSAAQLICDLVRENPGEITLIAVGRLTNLVHAVELDPGIVPLVKEVVIMGGAFGYNGHYGNVTPVAEANIIGDPHAADIVCGYDWPVVLVGLDVTMECLMAADRIEALAAKCEDGAFIRHISHGYQAFYKSVTGVDGFAVHDASAVIYALHPEYFVTKSGMVRVVPDGIAIGQTILKPDGVDNDRPEWTGRPSQKVCVQVDDEALLNFYDETILNAQK